MSSSSSAARQALSPTVPYPYAEAVAGADPVASTESEVEKEARIRQEGFERGRAEERVTLTAELESALRLERERIADSIAQFGLDRQNYYRRVETEIVQLALAIARKILHRETQVDPHALLGVVRVTLDKLDASTQVHLFVPPRDATEWRHLFMSNSDNGQVPEVHEDPALPPGECRIESSLGTTEVGLERQLKEIETGLMDLLAERPGGGRSDAVPPLGREPGQ